MEPCLQSSSCPLSLRAYFLGPWRERLQSAGIRSFLQSSKEYNTRAISPITCIIIVRLYFNVLADRLEELFQGVSLTFLVLLYVTIVFDREPPSFLVETV